MPLRKTETYQSGTDIWLEPPRGFQAATIDETFIQSDVNNNQLLPSGAALAGVHGSDFYRWLPRAHVDTEVSTSDTVVGLDNAQPFVAGDTLAIIAPSAQINLALTWANSDTADITVDGQTVTHTVSGFTSLTALAVAIADQINADPTLSRKVKALPEAQRIHLYALDFLSTYPIVVSEVTAGTGTIDVEDSPTNLQPNRSIGAVSIVSAASTTQSITLTANSALRLPIGMPIGDPAYKPFQGLNNSEHDLEEGTGSISTVTEGATFASRMPYWDGQLASLFRRITVLD